MSKTMNTAPSIREYFQNETFVIPNYQRGYKWGIKDSDGQCAVSVLMDDLLNAKANNKTEYFVQGVTYHKEDNKIVLIDGQQRTTTFYILMKFLGYQDLPKIEYEIRKESDRFLNGDFNEAVQNENEEYQDIYFFKNAYRVIGEKLGNEKCDSFKAYVLDKVKLFFIEVNSKDATKVFSMMNGQKAKMKDDELIKASLLSKSSRINRKSTLAEEWEINLLRNKYAREWDKWLYWWNKKSVKEFYGSGNNPMGLLLEYFYYINVENKSNEYSYEHFNESFFKENKDAKLNYKKIRDLQKSFEDLFNHYETYNYLGIILKTSNKKEALLYLLSNEKKKKLNAFVDYLKVYAMWKLVGATHVEITNFIEQEDSSSCEILKERAIEAKNKLDQAYVYWNENDEDFDDDRKEIAFRQLLRMNVEMDNQLQRKFDFSIWNNRSLEHIYPKSKKGEIEWSESASVHSIGNLVLLYGKDNSSFGALPFEDKKTKMFNYFFKDGMDTKANNEKKNILKSNSLLHTISIFSNNKWKNDEVQKNKIYFIEGFKKSYKI